MEMHLLLSFTLLVIGVGVGTSLRVSYTKALHNSQINLAKLLMNTRQQQTDNPQRSLVCFDYYLPLLDSLSEEYKNSYNACLAKADADIEKIDSSTHPDRELIEASAQSSCVAIERCTQRSGSIDYFSCFTESAKDNTNHMYTISANASETLAEVRERYRLIENEKNRCKNASERVYIEQTYQVNYDLQACLKGETPAPTTTQKPTTAITEGLTTVSHETTLTTEEWDPDANQNSSSSEKPVITSSSTVATTIESTTKPNSSTTENSSGSDSSSSSEESESSESSESSISDSSSKSSSESSSNQRRFSEVSNDVVLPEEDLYMKKLKNLLL